MLISDYDKGVCTPALLRALIDGCREPGRPRDRRPDPFVRLFEVPLGALHDPEPARGAARHGDDDRPGRGRAGGRQATGRGARPGVGPRDARPRRHGAGPRPTAAPSWCRRGPGRSTTSPAPATWSSRWSGSAWPAAPITTRRPRWGTWRAAWRSRRSASPCCRARRSSADLIDHHRAEGASGSIATPWSPPSAASGRPGGRSSSRTAASTCCTSGTCACSARPPNWATSSSSGSTPTRASGGSRARAGRSTRRRPAPSCSRAWSASMRSPSSTRTRRSS